MMKIAVACEGNQITQHFGHCECFNLFDTENGKIVSSESVLSPGHKPGALPVFLNDKGCKVVIAGGMGGGAVDIFNDKDIEVIIGVTGTDKDAVEAYLAGKLKSTGSICHDHDYEDECKN